MKSVHLGTAIIAMAWVLGGCIMGGDSDSDTANPEPTSKANINPGHYMGDFAAITPGTQYEPEFVLRSDGTFRYIVSGTNEALYWLDGKWKSQTDSMYLQDIQESYGDFGRFETWQPIINDSSTIRQITDSSFQRLEYLPFAHDGAGKIDWVTYRKVDYPTLKQGTFELREEMEDTVVIVRFVLGSSNELSLESVRNDSLVFRQTSKWSQQGTYLVMNPVVFYEADSNQVFTATDTVDMSLAYRVKDMTEDGIKIWNGNNWDEFKKSK
jgi:hypothetical protein